MKTEGDERKVFERLTNYLEPGKREKKRKKGGAGFIASHVVCLLVHRYPTMRVIVLDKLDYCASLRNLESVASEPNFKFVKGDICSGDLVSYLLETERIDTVMHFAAQTHVDNSFGNSLAFTLNNTYGMREGERESVGFPGEKSEKLEMKEKELTSVSFFKTNPIDNRDACRSGGVQGSRRERGKGEEGATGEFDIVCLFFFSFYFRYSAEKLR